MNMATSSAAPPTLPTPDGLDWFRDRIQSLLSRRLAKGQTISNDDASVILAIALSVLMECRP